MAGLALCSPACPSTWTPNLEVEKKVTMVGLPLFRAGCSRGDCRVGVDRELPVGPVKLRSHSAGHPLPPAPTKPRRADRSRSFPRQPRRVQGPPAPGCGRALPSSRAGSFAFLGTACSVSVLPCPPENQFRGCGSSLQRVPGSSGPRRAPGAAAPDPGRACPPSGVQQTPAHSRWSGTLLQSHGARSPWVSPCSPARPAGTTLSLIITRVH